MKNSKDSTQNKTTRLSAQQQRHKASKKTSNTLQAASENISIDIELSHQLNEPFNSTVNVSNEGLTKDNSVITSNKRKVSNQTKLNDACRLKHKQVDLLQGIMDKQIQGISTMHPNFDKSQTALDPNRSLQEIPSPPLRYKTELDKLFLTGTEALVSNDKQFSQSQLDVENSVDTKFDNASMWSLIASPELASHLELLQLGGLIHLSEKFFTPIKTTKEISRTPINQDNQSESMFDNIGNTSFAVSEHPDLLAPLTEMVLLDLSDIYGVYAKYPDLTRYGFNRAEELGNDKKQQTQMPELLNDVFSPNWELILYPERFDNGVDSLATDVLACSVAVHILKQCPTRQTVNRAITAEQICQHMRSYVLNQCKLTPQFEQQYRQIRLFVGHVVMAAAYLGLTVSHSTQPVSTRSAKVPKAGNKTHPGQISGQPIYLNVSSRASLVTRYPNISRYYINGWA